MPLPPARGLRGRASRRRFTTLADQVFSSLSNVLAVVLVARVLDRDAFGRFALAYAVMVAALGISRSWFGTRISLVADPGEVLREARSVLGSLLLLAAPLVAAVWVAGRLLTGGAGLLLLVVALAAPVVCLQDAARFAAVAAGRPGAALASDAVWAAVLVGTLPFGDRLGGTTVLVLWLGAAVAALAVVLGWLAIGPDPRSGWSGLWRRHPTSESVSFGTVVSQAASLVVTSVAAATISPAAVGALRGASTVVGPLNVVTAFVNLALTPALVRRRRSDDLRFCAGLALVMLGVVGAWAAVVLAIPQDWGERLLADSWEGTRAVLPYTLLEYVGVCVGTVWVLGLKVRAEAGMLVRQKAVVALLTVIAGSAAAVLVSEAWAVAAALAGAAGVGAGLGFHHLRASVAAGPGSAGARVGDGAVDPVP